MNMNSNPLFFWCYTHYIFFKCFWSLDKLQNPTYKKCFPQPQIKFSTAKPVGNGNGVRPAAFGSSITRY